MGSGIPPSPRLSHWTVMFFRCLRPLAVTALVLTSCGLTGCAWWYPTIERPNKVSRLYLPDSARAVFVVHQKAWSDFGWGRPGPPRVTWVKSGDRGAVRLPRPIYIGTRYGVFLPVLGVFGGGKRREAEVILYGSGMNAVGWEPRPGAVDPGRPVGRSVERLAAIELASMVTMDSLCSLESPEWGQWSQVVAPRKQFGEKCSYARPDHFVSPRPRGPDAYEANLLLHGFLARWRARVLSQPRLQQSMDRIIADAIALTAESLTDPDLSQVVLKELRLRPDPVYGGRLDRPIATDATRYESLFEMLEGQLRNYIPFIGSRELDFRVLGDAGPDDRWLAGLSLTRHGVDALPVLQRGVEEPTPQVRRASLFALGAMGAEAADAVPQLIECTRDPDRAICALALRALANIGSGAAAALPAVRKALGDQDRAVRLHAMRALCRVAPTARSTLLSVTEKTDDADRDARFYALWLLSGWLVPRASDVVPILAERAVEDPDRDIRLRAARELRRYAKHSTLLCDAIGGRGDLTPVLLRALADDDPAVRCIVAHALGEMRSSAAAPLLAHALEDEDEEVHKAASMAVATIGSAAVPGLVSVLQDADTSVRIESAKLLSGMGPAADRARGALRQAVADSDPKVCNAALGALKDIGPNAADAAVALAALRAHKWSVQWPVVYLLSELRATHLPVLTDMLRSESAHVRRVAAMALARIGPRAEATVPALIEALKDRDHGVRGAAAKALGRIGSDDAVAGLKDLVERCRVSRDEEEIEALGAIGSEKATCVLVNALRHPFPRVRQKAVKALGQIGTPQALEAILHVPWDPNGRVNAEALRVLGERKVARAVPLLVQALAAEGRELPTIASGALVRIGSPAVAAVREASLSKNADLRRWAAWTLPRVEAETTLLAPLDHIRTWAVGNAEPYVLTEALASALEVREPQMQRFAAKALVRLLASESPTMRRCALAAVGGSLAAEPKLALPLLARALEGEDPAVREAAVKAIGELGSDTVAQDLVAATRDARREVHRTAIQEPPETALEAIPMCLAALHEPDRGARLEAAQTLGRIGRTAPEAVPALLERLVDREPRVRECAAPSLGEIGSESSARGLLASLADEDLRVRNAAATALARVGSSAVPALVDALRSGGSVSASCQLMEVLGEIGPAAASAASVLVDYLAHPTVTLRYAAASALAGMGSDHAAPVLEQALRCGKQCTRRRAAAALTALGTETAVEVLAQSLMDRDPRVREEAACALGNIGPRAKPSLLALADSLSDGDRSVRLRAAEALLKIRAKD